MVGIARASCERLSHLLGTLEVELFVSKRSFGWSSVDFCLDAKQRGVAAEVLAAQVVNVGAHQWPAELTRDPDDSLVRPVLLRDLVVLDLEVDVLRTEDPHQSFGVLARLAVTLLNEALAKARLEAACQRPSHRLEYRSSRPRSTFAWPRLNPFRKPAEDSAIRFLEPCAVTGEQGQVVALVLDAVARQMIVDHIRLETQDRLHVVLAAGLVELDRPVHDAVIGEAQRRRCRARAALHESLDLAGTVEQRVFGMDVEMDCGGTLHRGAV